MAANVPGHEDPAPALDHAQRRLLDAGHILVTSAWFVLTYTIGNRDTNAEHVLFGFALLLLGVFLVMLSPVAHRFPGTTRFGIAVADAVLFYFLELAPAAGN